MRKLFQFRATHILILVLVISGSLAEGTIAQNTIRAAGTQAANPPRDYWYYVGDEIVTLPLATDAFTVIYETDLSPPDVDNLGREIKTIAPVAGMKEILKPEQKLVELDSRVSEAQLHNILQDLRAKPGVHSVHPVFELPDARMTVTDQFIAQFAPDASKGEITAFNQKNNVEFVEATHLPDTYILRAGSGSDTIATANLYHESDLTVYATPDFVRFLDRQFTPNDTYFPNQWGLENNGSNSPSSAGTSDADMDASSAWDITRGDSGTVIAIIDEGVQLNHPDLNGKIVSSHTEVSGDSNGANPNNTWDAHGTNVAGIAAAETNNSQGISGVCPDCSLMPVQIAYSSYDGGPWISTDSRIANGIVWAADNGADVISNSWGGGSESTYINNAITYAVTNGRDSLGSVVLFAAGNDNTSQIMYPSTHPSVIAVGATSPCDQRKSPSSCDGEYWWGSNFGNGLDVVAPGVEWVSTDMMGSAGYYSGEYFPFTSGDYYPLMNGTSSATPAAAGVAALIISYRPGLTGTQVKNILQGSADDQVGSPGEDTSGWDQYMGWGRVNAHQALIEAGGYSCGESDNKVFIPLILK
jgi:thermitase